MRRTLRGRVSLLGLAAIATLLAVLIVVFQVILSAQLAGQLDDSVRLRAQAASSTVRVSDSGTISVRESPTDSALDASIWVYQGTTVVERPARNGALQATADRLAAGHGQFADGPDSSRLYALPIDHDGTRVGTVVAAISSESSDNAAHAALIGSIVVGVLLLLGSYPVLRGSASRALTPVAQMTREAAEWSAHDPTQRFGHGQRYTELASLADTLDTLLSRITAVMRHERHLAAELSHELRTPIARIGAEADLLLADSSFPGQHRGALVAIRATADSMNEIIETLLTAARAGLNRSEGVSDLVPLLRGIAGGRTSVDLADERLPVGLDLEVVRRILAPILENAGRYARDRITVTARRAADRVIIDIANDGPPISDDRLEEIFEPGFTGADGDHDGTGLGLALSRRLARAADGDVVARPVIGGACFRVELPPG